MREFLKLQVLIILAGFIVACGSPQGEKALTGDAKQISVTTGDVSLKVDPSNSKIEWVGAKPAYQHNGTINISDGRIQLDNGKVAGGKFTIDMNSIVNLDITDETDNKKLVGHLKSADFFDTENHPVAMFEISSVEPLSGNAEATHSVSGNLTIKDISKGITFPANILIDGDNLKVTSPVFVIDRTEWNIQYDSKKFFNNLKDKFILDEISLKLNLSAGL